MPRLGGVQVVGGVCARMKLSSSLSCAPPAPYSDHDKPSVVLGAFKRKEFLSPSVPKVKDSNGDQRSDKFQEDYLRILYT